MAANPKADAMTEEERCAVEKRQRDFERSLAGASVGKAGAYNLTPNKCKADSCRPRP